MTEGGLVRAAATTRYMTAVPVVNWGTGMGLVPSGGVSHHVGFKMVEETGSHARSSGRTDGGRGPPRDGR